MRNAVLKNVEIYPYNERVAIGVSITTFSKLSVLAETTCCSLVAAFPCLDCSAQKDKSHSCPVAPGLRHKVKTVELVRDTFAQKPTEDLIFFCPYGSTPLLRILRKRKQ